MTAEQAQIVADAYLKDGNIKQACVEMGLKYTTGYARLQYMIKLGEVEPRKWPICECGRPAQKRPDGRFYFIGNDLICRRCFLADGGGE